MREARPLVRFTAATILAGVTSSCSASRPALESDPVDGGVRVEFAAPTTVAALGAPGDSVWLRGITVLRGTAHHWTRDTLYVRILSASNASGRLREIPRGRVVPVPRQAGVFFRDSFTAEKTLGILVFAVLASAVAFVIVLRQGMES